MVGSVCLSVFLVFPFRDIDLPLALNSLAALPMHQSQSAAENFTFESRAALLLHTC